MSFLVRFYNKKCSGLLMPSLERSPLEGSEASGVAGCAAHATSLLHLQEHLD